MKFINRGHYWQNWKYKTIKNSTKVQQTKFQQQLKAFVFKSWMQCKRQLHKEIRYRQVRIYFGLCSIVSLFLFVFFFLFFIVTLLIACVFLFVFICDTAIMARYCW